MIKQYFFDQLVAALVEYQKLFHIEYRARYSGDTVGAENASVNRRLEWRGYRVLMDAADAFGFNSAVLLDEANLIGLLIEVEADAVARVIATLLATGSLPERSTIRPEHQTVLPTGNDALLKEQFSALEEGRADLIGLYFLADPKLVELGIIPAADHDAIVRDLRRREIACIYISHKLDEVLEVADRVSVLRQGQIVATTTPGSPSSAPSRVTFSAAAGAAPSKPSRPRISSVRVAACVGVVVPATSWVTYGG